MNPRKAVACGAMALAGFLMAGNVAFADASYDSTTQVTGGTLVDALKKMSFLSHSIRDAFAPQTTHTMVSGNRKATMSAYSTEIVDLDKEEMIHIDNVKKTYSVVTFAQMRQAMQNMPGAINQAKEAQPVPADQPKPNIKTTFDVKVNNTGVQKEVNGLMAQEQIITLTMTVTNLDAQNGAAAAPANGSTPPPAVNGATGSQAGPASMTYVVTTDAWISADPPEVKEIEDFDVRMAKKMMEGVDMQAWMAQMKSSFNNSGMNQMLSSQPGASDAMVQMGKELAKIKGTHVMDIVSMGGVVPAGTAAQGSSTATNQSSPTAGDVAGDAAQQAAANQTASSIGGLGGALAGSVLGGWHRKKTSTPPADTQQTAAATPSTTTNPDGTQTVVLMATTTQKANFSQSPVADSIFAIPAGYTEVASGLQPNGH